MMVDLNLKGKHNDKKTVEKHWHKKPKKKDMMTYTNFEGEYDDKEMVQKQVCTQHEQRDVMTNINLEGEHDEKKMVDNQVQKQPEKRDMMNDTNPERKDVVEKQQVATEDAPRLRKEESITEDWKMKAEILSIRSDILGDAKQFIESNREDIVRQDFVLISSKTKTKELDMWEEKSYGVKDKDDYTEDEAKTQVGTSADQEKTLADKEGVKMIIVKKKIGKTGRKMMRMLHKH
jgi:hypothetical protein